MAGDPNYGSVGLLLPFDGVNGATTTDDISISPKTVTLSGGAALSTVRAKYGPSALFLDGINDNVTTSYAQNIGAGMFTLEAHIRPTGAQTGRIISSQAASPVQPLIVLRVNSNGSLGVLLRNSSGSGLLDLASAPSLVAMDDTAWYHVALTRNASNLVDIWLEGASVASGASTTSPAGAANYNIGSQYGSAEFYKGYIENVRITEGVCRYEGTFTPPDAAFPNWQAAISGVIRDDTGAFASRTVRAYRRDTGALIGSAVSDSGTGAYSIPSTTIDEVSVLVLDDAAGALYNDICMRVIPD